MTSIGHEILKLFVESLNSKRPNTNKRVITEREAEILLKCYDFENDNYPLFQEVAIGYGITGERVRQLHNRSLRRLGGAGRNLDIDIPCVNLLELLQKSINHSSGKDKYQKLIEFWNKNMSEISGEIIIRLFSLLLYSDKEDGEKRILLFKDWKKEKLRVKRQELIKLRKENKRIEEIVVNQDYLLNKTIWFEKRTKWKNVKFNNLNSKRQVNTNLEYISGEFYSEKCKRTIQYESGLELDFITALEDMPRVKYFVEQPTKISYVRNGVNYNYTPDFAVFLDNYEAILVEIKDFTGMVDARVHRKTEALIDYCKTYGFGLLLTSGKHSIEKILEKKVHNENFIQELIKKLDERGGRTIFFNEFKKLQDKYNISWIEFLAVVLKYNLSLYPFPFKLNRKNNYIVFRDVIIKKK